MAQRRQENTDTDIHDPDLPSSEMQPVEPSVSEPTEGVSTLAGMFGAPTIVDEVREVPLPESEMQVYEVWVIRTNTDIEDMTVGVPIVHMAFKAGVRYKVPRNVAHELARLDYLMETPYPYDERRMARR